jgi:hypothetical protein
VSRWVEQIEELARELVPVAEQMPDAHCGWQAVELAAVVSFLNRKT